MAGMADGDNRYYGCQDKFAAKITDTTVDMNVQFFSFYADTTVTEITLTLSRIVALPTIRYYSFWTCGR